VIGRWAASRPARSHPPRVNPGHYSKPFGRASSVMHGWVRPAHDETELIRQYSSVRVAGGSVGVSHGNDAGEGRHGDRSDGQAHEHEPGNSAPSRAGLGLADAQE
jgi:hypothetical protein